MSEIEIEWIQQAKSGDKEAFGNLVRSYQAPVYNLCYRMLGDPGEAEDAAQETFLRAYRAIGRFDPEKRLINWLLTIAANHSVDRLRKRKLLTLSFDALRPREHIPDWASNPEAALRHKEDQQAITELLSRLSPRDRAAIVMRYWHGLSYEEIAETLSVSVSAVKSRLHRARRALAEQWRVRGEHAILEGGRNDRASAF